MKYKKMIPVFLAAAVLFFSACSHAPQEENSETMAADKSPEEKEQSPDGEETLIWRMKLPVGADEAEEAKRLVEIWQDPLNALLAKKGAGYQVQIEPLGLTEASAEPAVSVADELEALKEAGEQTDLISIRAPEQYENLEGYYLTYPECVKRGLFMPLDPLLDTEQGKALRSAVTETDLERARWDGKIYGISAVLPQTGCVIYSREQMQKYGVTEEELLPPLFENETLMQKIRDLSGEAPYGMISGDVRYELGLWVTEPSENLALQSDGTFGIITETPKFRERLETLIDWKEKGLLKIVSGEQINTCFARQGGGADINYSDQPYSAELPVFAGAGSEKAYAAFLVPQPEEWALAPYWGDSKQCIASWTQKMEQAKDFLVRIMADPEIANLIQYGREGTEYTLKDGKAFAAETANLYLRLFGEQYTNPLITYSAATTAENKAEYARRFHETYEAKIPDGFRFDPAPVLDQIVKTNRVFGESEAGRKISGLQFEDVDRIIAEITENLKAAGMDDVVREANRQLMEWKDGVSVWEK